MAEELKRTVILELEVDAQGSITGLKNVEKQIKKTGDETKNASKEAGNYSSAMTSLDGAMGGVAGKTKGLIAGVKGLTAGFKGLRGAIIATGLGALLIVITSLVTYFNRTREGTEKLNKIMAVLGSTMDVVLDTVGELGGLIFGLFSGDGESTKAIKEFGGLIFDTIGLPIKNVITTIKALGNAVGKLLGGEGLDAAFDELEKGAFEIGQNFKEAGDGIEQVFDSVKGKINEVIEEGEKASLLADRQNKLERDRLQFQVREAELQREIANARLETENLELSAEERLEANQKAQELVNQLAQERIALQKEQIAIVEEQQALGQTDIAGEEELAGLKKELINLETQRDSQLRSIITREKSINTEIKTQRDTQRAKDEEAAKAKEAERLQLLEDNQLAAEIENKARQDALDGIKEIQDARELANAKEIENIDERYAELKRIREEDYQEELAQGDLNREQRLLAEAKYLDDLLVLDKEYADGKEELAKEESKVETNFSNQTKDEKINNSLQAGKVVSDGIQSLFGENKAAAIASATIDTALAVISALKNPFPLNIALSALATATGLKSLSQIKSTPPPKAARGMMIGGKLHSQGGTLIEAESGEAILNRRTMANPLFRSLASAMNEAGGGVKFARGGMVGMSEANAILQEALSFQNNTQFVPVLVTEDLNTVETRVAVTEELSTL